MTLSYPCGSLFSTFFPFFGVNAEKDKKTPAGFQPESFAISYESNLVPRGIDDLLVSGRAEHLGNADDSVDALNARHKQ